MQALDVHGCGANELPGRSAQVRWVELLCVIAGSVAVLGLTGCATDAPSIDMTKLGYQDLRDVPTLEVEKDCNFYKSANFVDELQRRGLIDMTKGKELLAGRIRIGMTEAEVFCALPRDFSIYGSRQVTDTQFGQIITFVMPATTGSEQIIVMLDHGEVTTVTYG